MTVKDVTVTVAKDDGMTLKDLVEQFVKEMGREMDEIFTVLAATDKLYIILFKDYSWASIENVTEVH